MNDDDYGRDLGQHLQANDPMPLDHELGARTVRAARAVRRRRRMTAAVGLGVVAIAIPVGVAAGPGWLRPDPAGPITARPSPDVTSPAGPAPSSPSAPAAPASQVDVALARLKSGDAATVDIVRAGRWIRPDGGSTAVATTTGEGYGGTFVRWGDSGLVAQVWRPGGDPADNVVTAYGTAGSAPAVIDIRARNLVAGPDGSAWMIDDEKSLGSRLVLARWDAQGVLSRFEVTVEDAAAATFAVAGDALFVADETTAALYTVGDGKVTRRAQLTDTERIGVADTTVGRVVLRTAEGCSAVLDTSTMVVAWRSCAYTVTAFSADGRYAYGTSVGDENGPEGAVLDNRTGTPLLRLANAEAGRFDAADRLNVLAVGKADELTATHAVAVCTVAGVCHRASDPVTVQTNSGRHGLDLVG